MIKVWLREPHQSDDEAIKLVVDETTDVSDLLLKVPELLRVRHLKPSEIQAEYNDAVLSNRLVISVVFEGANEGTLVIRPRPGILVSNNAFNISSSTAAAETRGSSMKNGSSSVHPRTHPPPSPRPKHVGKTPCATPEPLKRAGSLHREKTRLPVSRSNSKVTTMSNSNLRRPSAERTTVPMLFGKEKSTCSRQTTPRRDVSVSRVTPQPLTPPPRIRHLDPNAVSSRYLQEAEKVKTFSRKAHTGPVCSSFKPQWGKPLCISCNHTKQAHWAPHERIDSSREDHPLVSVDTESETKQLSILRANRTLTGGGENGGRLSEVYNSDMPMSPEEGE